MAKRKVTKGQTIINKALHRILKIEHHDPHKLSDAPRVFRKSRQFLLHMWHQSCYFCYKPSDTSLMRKRGLKNNSRCWVKMAGCCVKPCYCRNMLLVSWQDGDRVVFNNKCTEFKVKFKDNAVLKIKHQHLLLILQLYFALFRLKQDKLYI